VPREKSIAERFDAFVETVGGRLYKPNRRFLRDALFGLLEKGSTRLSEIGRALDEPYALIQTEKRLSRGLASPRYNGEAVEEDYLKLVAPLLRDRRHRRPTIAVDITDIAKPRAKKMPYLGQVWDGSEKELAKGYNVVSVEAVGERGRRLPLLSRLFSYHSPEFRSQSATVLDAVEKARQHVPDDAFWAFDSAFDAHDYLERFHEMGLSFAVRLSLAANRKLYTPEGMTDVEHLVASLPRLHIHRTLRQSRKSSWLVQVGWIRDVRLPLRTTSGWLSTKKLGKVRYSVVVVSGGHIGQKPLAILTTLDVRSSADAARIVDTYLERWGVEEANRFTKQGFDLEDVRALTWTGLKRMAQLVQLAYGFLALLVHGPRKQVERVAATFKAFGPVPTYLYYRLLQGIGRLLKAGMDCGP
jgi:hypothetical protein